MCGFQMTGKGLSKDNIISGQGFIYASYIKTILTPNSSIAFNNILLKEHETSQRICVKYTMYFI